MATVDYDTGQAILDDVLSRAGDLEAATAEMIEEAKRYVHRGYWGLCRAFAWLWDMRYPPMQFILPKKLSVTLNVTEDNVAVTGITPTVSGSLADYHMVLDRDGVPMRVVSGTGATATLQAGYYGLDGTGVSAYFFKNEVVVATDILVPVKLVDLHTGKPVEIIGIDELAGRYKVTESGDPEYASFVDEDRIRVAKWPETKRVMEMQYTRRPANLTFDGVAGTDTPIVPRDMRWLIADYALYFMLADDDDDKAEKAVQLLAGRIQEFREQQVSKINARFWVPTSFNLGVR